MGPLQTYFYLVLIGGTATAVWLLLIGIAIRQVIRGLHERGSPLTFLLVGGAVVAALTFLAAATIGITVSVVRSGR
jgi:hypothetical protein